MKNKPLSERIRRKLRRIGRIAAKSTAQAWRGRGGRVRPIRYAFVAGVFAGRTHTEVSR